MLGFVAFNLNQDRPMDTLNHPDTSALDMSATLMIAAHAILDHITPGLALSGAQLAAIMTRTHGGTDAEGAWDWKTAYDAGEAATVQIGRAHV